MHVCAQYGCVSILDWLCENHGASPTSATFVSIAIIVDTYYFA